MLAPAASQLHLKGISYEIEEPRDIQQLAELHDSPDLVATLRSLGVARYSASRRSVVELAAACAARTLRQAKVAPAAVGLLLLASQSFDGAELGGKDVQWLIAKLGLENVYPVGVTLSECANFIVALAMAIDALRQRRYQHALIIAADKIRDGRSRIVPPNVAVASDAAASVLLSSEAAGPWEVLATEQSMIPLAYQQSAYEDFGRYLKTSVKGLTEISARTLAAAAKKPEDFSWLIANNYNLSVSRLLASLSGFPPERIYATNIGRYGHCFGADNLINLADCANEYPPAAGDLFCLLASGPHMWATAVLRKT
jgi:3-oxoacyl-[acyl-carrier-protein] synthase III